MTRREWLGAGSALVLNAAAPRRPNIVLLLADDLGSGDLSSYGCPDIRTPHADSIGAGGVRFTQFYSNGPECSPTRTALLTGRYQQRAGGMECALGVGGVGRYDEAIWLQKQGELGLPVSETSLAAMLKARGYDTACFGKWHLGYRDKFWPNRHGFDEYFGILGGNADYFTHKEEGENGVAFLYHNTERVTRPGYTTDLFVEESIRWLKGRSRNPFFLYLPFNAPHAPIQDPDGFDPKTGTAPVRQGHRPIYAKMVERMDRGVGAVLAQLGAMGAADNTIVLFLSDNGGDANGRNEPLRGKKSSLWEGGIRVPCLVRWPGVLPAGKTTRQVGLTMDLLPTLLAAAGAKAPIGRKLDGADLLPVLKGQKPAFSRTVFWRFKRGDRVRKAVRDGDLKYVAGDGKEELHNLAQDEREQKDLLAGSGADAGRLKAKLAAWERDVMAPRLKPFRGEPG
ncbi:MAG: sulfatase-like hydrolase/transferase [Acidobacteria bacterium]|nr:sulfatase-like hydrolase/transferase [Acidobacteriota bacterium]